jgi:hypothetical protein
MLKFFRKQKYYAKTPQQIIEFCRQKPGKMFLGPEFIAVYHRGTDRVLIFPHDNMNMTDEEANTFVQKQLERYNATI